MIFPPPLPSPVFKCVAYRTYRKKRGGEDGGRAKSYEGGEDGRGAKSYDGRGSLVLHNSFKLSGYGPWGQIFFIALMPTTCPLNLLIPVNLCKNAGDDLHLMLQGLVLYIFRSLAYNSCRGIIIWWGGGGVGGRA